MDILGLAGQATRKLLRIFRVLEANNLKSK